MSSSTYNGDKQRALRAKVTADALTVDLADGRTLIVPLSWYPRLLHGNATERARWRLIGKGVGIHWADLDEDISVAGLLAGKASGESQQSLETWLANRRKPSEGIQPTRKKPARG